MKNVLDEINLLTKKHVHIKNTENLRILDNIKNGGIHSLQVITDFDKTITKQHENGKPHMSSFAMFGKCPSVTEDYMKTVNALTSKYYPIEIDPNISKDEKFVLMEEWWALSEVALKGLKVSRKEMEEVCVQLAPTLRDGSKELFDTLAELKVPVLVFSAGLGDIVEVVLKHCGVLTSNMKIVSNFLKYNNEGVIEGFQDTLIHVYNKNEFAIKNTDFYTMNLDRGNVLLMGDSIGDADMSEGMENLKNVLKIGFLYDRVEEALPKYMDRFDIVLQDDQTMEIPNAIVNFIKSNEKE